MESFIHKYIKEVKSYITLHSKAEKTFIKKFKIDVCLSYENEEFHNYDELINVYGSPNEVACAYIQTIENDKITQHINSKKMFICLIVCIMLGIAAVYTYDVYRLDKLLNDVKEEENTDSGVFEQIKSEG